MFSLYLSKNSAWFGKCPLHGDTRVQVVTSVRSAAFYNFGLNVLVGAGIALFHVVEQQFWRHSRLWQQY